MKLCKRNLMSSNRSVCFMHKSEYKSVFSRIRLVGYDMKQEVKQRKCEGVSVMRGDNKTISSLTMTGNPN